MDCVSKISPTTSVTPPISPLKFIQPATTLPPLKNLPTWNRTSLERAHRARCLSKDTAEKIESHIEENICQGTQTSPSPLSSSRVFASAAPNLSVLSPSPKARSLERKLFFVENQYEGVLSKLREEVAKLKEENKELNFNFVMKTANIPLHPETIDTATSPIDMGNALDPLPVMEETKKQDKNGDEFKIVLMDKELQTLKQALKEAKNKNAYLSSLVEQQKQRQRVAVKSAKHTSEPQTRHPIGNIGHPPIERYLPKRIPLPPVDSSKREDITEREKRPPQGYVVSIHHNSEQVLNGDIVDRLILQDDKEIYEHKVQQRPSQTYKVSEVRNTRYKGHLIAPFENDFELRKPVEPLPRLSVRAAARSARYMETYRRDGMTLPAVRGPAVTLSERQKRAHALHVQRQKTNREYTLFKLM